MTPRRAVQDRAIADAVEMAVNGWIKDNEFETPLEHVVECALLGYGVTKVSVEADPNADPAQMSPSRVVVDVIGPGSYIRDPESGWTDAPRFEGHCFNKDLDDVKADPRYDQEAVAMLSANSDSRKQKDSPFPQDKYRNAELKQVTLYELYFPEQRKIVTLGMLGRGSQGGGSGKIIRIADYKGPKKGPYRLWGIYCVPGQVYPLSPLAATFEQFMELQDHAISAAEEASTQKSFGVYNILNKKDGQSVTDVANGAMVGLNDPNSFKTATVGGTSPQRLDYITVLRNRLDRVMGYSDAQRGVSNADTATAQEIAQTNSDLRIEWMRRQVRKDTAAVLYQVGWYMFHEPSIVQHVSRVDPKTGQPEEFLYVGGTELEGEASQAGQSWEMYGLDIEAYSMQRVDNALIQKRAQDMFQLLPNLLPIMVEFPQINWRQMWDTFGETINMKNFSKTIFGDGQNGMLLPPPPPPPEEHKPPTVSVSYEDVPPEAQAQILGLMGIKIDPMTLARHQTLQRQSELSAKGEQRGQAASPGTRPVGAGGARPMPGRAGASGVSRDELRRQAIAKLKERLAARGSPTKGPIRPGGMSRTGLRANAMAGVR